jgi:hypothetical protein
MRAIRFFLAPREDPVDTAVLQLLSSPDAPLPTIRAPGFPARVSLVAAGAVDFEPTEQNRRYQLRLELLDQAQRWVGHYEQVLHPQAPAARSETPMRVTFVQPIDELVIPSEGTYTLQVVVDSTLLGSHLVNARADMAA